MTRFTESTTADAFRAASRGDRGVILVVDDEAPIVEVLCMLLEDEGYTAIGATDPANAVPLIRRRHPGLMITDVMMPGMNGYELAALARAIEPAMRIVYMSAVVEPNDDDLPFLAKPFDLGQVVDTIDAELHAS